MGGARAAAPTKNRLGLFFVGLGPLTKIDGVYDAESFGALQKQIDWVYFGGATKIEMK